MGSLENFLGGITSPNYGLVFKFSSRPSEIGTWLQHTRSKIYSILSVAF